MKNVLIYFLFVLVVSCASDAVNVKFIEIKNNIARFEIINNSDQDISKITYEVTFLDRTENLILKDTTSYKMENDSKQGRIPFLKANEKTFIVHKVPENCEKAEIALLKIDFIK